MMLLAQITDTAHKLLADTYKPLPQVATQDDLRFWTC